MLPPFAMSHRPYPQDGTGRLRCACGATEGDERDTLSFPCPVYAPALTPRPFVDPPSSPAVATEATQREERCQTRVQEHLVTGGEALYMPAINRHIAQEEWATTLLYAVWSTGPFVEVGVRAVVARTPLFRQQESIRRCEADLVRWHCELRHPDGVTPRIDLSSG